MSKSFSSAFIGAMGVLFVILALSEKTPQQLWRDFSRWVSAVSVQVR